MVLDIKDFIPDQGGDPARIRESQRRRHAPESAVDDIINLFEDHKKSRSEISNSTPWRRLFTDAPIAKYLATQVGSRINATQKEIGAKKKVCQRIRWKTALISCTEHH